MSQLPTIPDEIQIEVYHDFGGTTYRLSPARDRRYRFIAVPYFVIISLLFLCVCVSACIKFFQLMLQRPDIINLFFLTGFSCGLFWMLLQIYLLLGPQHPELVTLKENSFYYDSGSSAHKRLYDRFYRLQHPHPYGFLGGYFRNRIQLEIDRQDLEEFYRLSLRKAELLYLKYEGRHIEIGERLNDAERTWLLDQIRVWQDT